MKKIENKRKNKKNNHNTLKIKHFKYRYNDLYVIINLVADDETKKRLPNLKKVFQKAVDKISN